MKLKFENVDVEQCLRSVMERNTKHYQSDFEYDVGSMERIAQTKHPERTPLFWMSRPSGTWCFRERDVFIRDSDAFYTWQFYKDTRDTILAYTVEITGMEGTAIKGNLYTQDYRAMAEYIEKNAFPAATARVLFEGHLAPMKFTYEDYQANRLALQAKHGKEIKLWLEPADSAALDTLLQNVRRSRQNFAPGVFEDHLDKMIAAEKRSVTHFLKEAAANAPHPALNKKTKEHPQR